MEGELKMRSKFDGQLRKLNDEMISMGSIIEHAIQDAIDAFFNQNTEKARQIMQEDELVDQEQKKIENICFQLLIQQQPVARDLRTITAAMKMVTDMERIGDQAADISELTIMMADSPYRLKEDNIRKMSAETIIMLLQAVEVMQQSPDYAEHAADLLMVNKYLERIGDHATNIAEWVIFSLDNRSAERNEAQR